MLYDRKTIIWVLSEDPEYQRFINILNTSPRTYIAESEEEALDFEEENIPVVCCKINRTRKGLLDLHKQCEMDRPDLEIKYLIIGFPPSREVLDFLDSDDHDAIIMTYEQLFDDPWKVAFDLINWCPEIWTVDYGAKTQLGFLTA